MNPAGSQIPGREEFHSTEWHSVPVASVVDAVAAEPIRGLSADEARRRLAADGPNVLRTEDRASVATLVARQLASVVIWVLVGAAIASFLLGELLDGTAIVAIVALNAAIGFLQEYRAERAIAALARLTAPRARVVRDGHSSVVPAAEIVRGDVLLLEGGDLVAADARLLEAVALRANEAPLTGESEAVEKRAGDCLADAPLAERSCMIFLGTAVVAGTGRAVVTATGMQTEVGRIAALLQSASSGETPLQRRLDRVAARLLLACLGIVGLVFALGLARSMPPFELFLGAVSLAVAAIPEGLPAVVTVALALGVSRMARRRALVRHLPAIETLGSADVICTDKTGTLTVGEMTVTRIAAADEIFTVTGEGYSTEGAIFAADERLADAEGSAPVLRELLVAAAACNEAELASDGSRPTIVGDPTEGALLVAARKGGVDRSVIEAEWSRAYSIPFDAERKRMTIVRRRGVELVAFVKGAPEVILERSTCVHTGEGTMPLGALERARIAEAASVLAGDGLRVLALARRSLDSDSGADEPEEVERELELLGLVALHDPPRPGVRDAVARCRRAGIRVVMITGDHPETARAIAHELGILRAGDRVVLGRALEAMSDAELAATVSGVAAYARVTAEDKLRIVRAWKSHGSVVAMTGDGVNDAPALKEASIGVAMGISGTEVTKQAAALVIADDDFTSIVAAVEEGRGVDDNIRKTLAYLLAGNAGELTTMLFAVLAGWPFPLLPIHLLWINLVSDGLPALALATDPIDGDVLARPPRPANAELFDRAFVTRLAVVGALTALAALSAFALTWLVDGGDVGAARNAAFTTLVIAELLRSFGARSEERTVWQLGLFSNARLFVVVAVSLGLQLAIHYIPFLQGIFGTQPITAIECMSWFVLGSIPVATLEARKVLRRS